MIWLPPSGASVTATKRTRLSARPARSNPSGGALIEAFPDRFLTAIDAVEPSHCERYQGRVGELKRALADPPPEIARRVAFESAEHILTKGRSAIRGRRPAQREPGVDLKWIDTHTHPTGGPGSRENIFSPERLDQVITIHKRWGVEKVLLALPASPKENPELERRLIQATRSRPDQFAFLGGGLQPLIEQAAKSGQVSTELGRRFEAKAEEIARSGAVGFGEMTALHFSFADVHPYVEAPPDHPLFLLLADLAAKHDVPIDLHIEAVTKDMATPQKLRQINPLNPPNLRANISALERLLSHNREARIVWAHIGWDNTGEMTIALLRRLREAHPNLYRQIRIPTRPGVFPQNTPLDLNGKIRPEWLDLIRSFPDRFVLGSDTFLARPDFEVGLKLTGSLLAELPPDLARQVGYENAIHIYRLR